MADAALKLMTVDEFLAWDDGTDTRYELVDGVIVAMASPFGNHRTIVGNTAAELDGRLRLRPPCRVEAEAGVRLSAYRFFVADLAVTCAPPRNAAGVDAPVILVEVLSPSTRKDDVAVKLPEYQQVESVREIWLVDAERRRVQLWSRDAAVPSRWIVEDFVGGAGFTSAVLEGRVELDALYRNTTL